MPLITLCGAPLSGKTLMTQALVAEIKAKHPDREVFVINYESLRLSRAVVFKGASCPTLFY
jgi:tRNA uridine 5-carbamoylmethylation protein Kti12